METITEVTSGSVYSLYFVNVLDSIYVGLNKSNRTKVSEEKGHFFLNPTILVSITFYTVGYSMVKTLDNVSTRTSSLNSTI